MLREYVSQRGETELGATHSACSSLVLPLLVASQMSPALSTEISSHRCHQLLKNMHRTFSHWLGFLHA